MLPAVASVVAVVVWAAVRLPHTPPHPCVAPGRILHSCLGAIAFPSHQAYAKANTINLIVNPYVGLDSNGGDGDGKDGNSGQSGELLPFVYPYPDAVAVGGADDNIPSYNFRLCVTQNASNRVAFPKPDNYQAADFELVRR